MTIVSSILLLCAATPAAGGESPCPESLVRTAPTEKRPSYGSQTEGRCEGFYAEPRSGDRFAVLGVGFGQPRSFEPENLEELAIRWEAPDRSSAERAVVSALALRRGFFYRMDAWEDDDGRLRWPLTLVKQAVAGEKAIPAWGITARLPRRGSLEKTFYLPVTLSRTAVNTERELVFTMIVKVPDVQLVGAQVFTADSGEGSSERKALGVRAEPRTAAGGPWVSYLPPHEPFFLVIDDAALRTLAGVGSRHLELSVEFKTESGRRHVPVYFYLPPAS